MQVGATVRRKEIIMPRIALLVVVGLGLVIAGADKKKEPPQSLYGEIRTVEEKGAQLEVKSRQGKFQVLVEKEAWIMINEIVLLRDVEMGTFLHVLGRHTDKAPGTHGGEHPPTMTGVTAIIKADKEHFHPPPIPPKLKERRQQWRSGAISKHGKDLFLEGGIMLPLGGNTPVIVFKHVKKTDFAKKQRVLMWGRGNIEDSKKKRFRADEIVILAPEVSNKDTYPAVLDFTGKLRPSGRNPKKGADKTKGKPDF